MAPQILQYGEYLKPVSGNWLTGRRHHYETKPRKLQDRHRLALRPWCGSFICSTISKLCVNQPWSRRRDIHRGEVSLGGSIPPRGVRKQGEESPFSLFSLKDTMRTHV